VSRDILLAASSASDTKVYGRTLVLLLMIAIYYADGLPVTSDSETFSYLGKNVKVSGSFFAALTSRFWTALIVQESLTSVARKTIRLLMAFLGLILVANHAQAGLGWTLAQFEQQYGKPVLDQEQFAGRIGYVFNGDDYLVAAFFRNTQVSRILYIRRGGSVFDWGTAKALLAANAPDAIWEDASRNEADNSYRVNGTKDGVESYYASLTGDGQMLAIWTKEDDEAGRTKPAVDTPSGSGVVGSSDNRTGEVAAGQVAPSIDRELTPEKIDSEVTAKPTASSPVRRLAATHPVPTKTPRNKLRSSMSHHETFHVATFDAKARSAAPSHRTAGGQPPGPHPSPTPLLMNAGTGLYNSDYTQPFKDAKKAAGP
jgi:hypothetical protein